MAIVGAGREEETIRYTMPFSIGFKVKLSNCIQVQVCGTESLEGRGAEINRCRGHLASHFFGRDSGGTSPATR